MGILLAILAAALAPQEIEVQGLYEGTLKTDKVEARVAALGKKEFKAYLRLPLKDGKTDKFELDGKTEGETVTFTGKFRDAEVKAVWSPDRSIKGTGGLQLKRVERKPPTLGKKPPPGAVILLDGKDFSQMTKDMPDDWKPAEDGSIQVPKKGMNSKPVTEGGFLLHVEFMNPFMPAARGQGRGNSGCYLPNGQEIQVLDSFGMDTYTGGGCGGLYKYKDPDAFDVFSLASLPPGEWQTYDIEIRVKGDKGLLTVLHNGIKIHDNVEMARPRPGGKFHFQDHNDPVRYRNIWVLPLK